MIIDFKSINKIFVIRGGQKKLNPLAKVVDVVINPDSFLFEAYWVLTPAGMRILLPKDIMFFEKDIIQVKDENVFITEENIVRLKPLLKREIPILKANVYCNEVLLGRVYNFTFDTLSPRILQLEVRKGFWGLKKSLIHISQIYKTDEKGIHVYRSRDEKILKKKDSNNVSAVDAMNCERD